MSICRSQHVAAGRPNPFALWFLVGLFLFSSLVHCRAISGDALRPRDNELEGEATRKSQSQTFRVRTMLLSTMSLPTISPTKSSKRPTSTSASASSRRPSSSPSAPLTAKPSITDSPSSTTLTAKPSITDSPSSTTLLTLTDATEATGAIVISPNTYVLNMPTSLPPDIPNASAKPAETSGGGNKVALGVGLSLLCLLVISISLAAVLYKKWQTHRRRHPQVGYIAFVLSLLRRRPPPSTQTQPPSNPPRTRRPSLRLTITPPAAFSEKPTNRALPTPAQHQPSTGGLTFPKLAARISLATRRTSDLFHKRPNPPYANRGRSPVSPQTPLDQQRNRVLSNSSQHITVQFRNSVFIPSPMSPSPAESPVLPKRAGETDTLIARFGIPDPPKRTKSTKRGSTVSRLSRASMGGGGKAEFAGGLERSKSSKSQKSMGSDWSDDDSMWRHSTSTLASYYTRQGDRE